MVDDRASDQQTDEVQGPPEEDDAQVLTKLQAQVPPEIRNVSFPAAVRGYDRRAVDAYVQRVNRVIAELEVTRSPQAAVRHAVDRVSEQTKGILQQARESGEQITTAAREEAEQIVGEAKAEAADLVVNASAEADARRAEADEAVVRAQSEAETIVASAEAEAAERKRLTQEEITALQEEAQSRMSELQTDTEGVWSRRQELLDEIEEIATRLQEAAGAAAVRFSPDRPKEAADWPQAELEAEPTLVTAPSEPSEESSGKSSSRGRGRSSRESDT
jgi:DivIVA domain-containing protein